MIQRLFALLLIAAVFSLVHAAPVADATSYFYRDSVQAEQHAALTQIDFDGYYENLIQSEKDAVNRAITTSIISGVTLGFGVFTTIIAFSDNGNTDKNSWANVHKQTLKIAGVGLITAGTIGLAFSLHNIICGTGENSKRASYEHAYEIYKRRRSELKDGAKVIVAPAVDLFGGSAGMQLNVLF